MNYLKEVLSFNELLMTETLSTGQIALWYALMYINNKCGWKESFTAANNVLNTYTRLSDKGIIKARNALIQKGLIRYKSRGNKAGIYTVLSISNSTEQNKHTANSSEQSAEHSTEHCSEQSAEYSTEQSATLNKQNKTKQNKTTVAVTEENTVKIFERYENLMGKTMSKTATEDIDSFISDGISYDLILAVMDYAVDGGKGNWNYMRATLEGLSAEGIRTVDAWKRQQAEYKQRKQNGTAQVQKSKFANYEDTNKIDYAALENKLLEKMLEG